MTYSLGLRLLPFAVLKFGFHCRPNTGSFSPEGTDQPKNIRVIDVGNKNQHVKFTWPDEKEDDLDPTDDGEASEESHGASNETQLGLRLDLLVSLDVVKGGRVKVDLHQLEGWGR